MTTRRTPSKRAWLALGAAAAVGLLVAGCGGSGGGYGSNAPATSTGAASGTIGVGRTSVGAVLTDGAGHTMYILTADSPSTSTCAGACASAWPVVAPTTAHASSVTATLGSMTRPDGSRQLTVDGLPAYTYVADPTAGTANGQGAVAFGGTWWTLGADGKPITTPATSSAGRY